MLPDFLKAATAHLFQTRNLQLVTALGGRAPVNTPFRISSAFRFWSDPVPAQKAVPGDAGTAGTGYGEAVLDLGVSTRTMAGEPLSFPAVDCAVHSLVISMEPGETTGWHQHHCPVYCYILEGEVTVTYQGQGKRRFRKGEGMLEAMRVTHQGENTGQVPTRILAVFMEGDGQPATVNMD